MTHTRELKSVVVEGTTSDIVVSETPSSGARVEVVIGPGESVAQLYLSSEETRNLIAALSAVLPVIAQEPLE